MEISLAWREALPPLALAVSTPEGGLLEGFTISPLLNSAFPDTVTQLACLDQQAHPKAQPSLVLLDLAAGWFYTIGQIV